MKKSIYLLFILFFVQTNAQITRYPYIQSTTQNSTIIAWKTTSGVLGSVRYGTDSTNLNFTVNEVGTNTNHAVLLENLQENTLYYYAIYSGTSFQTSEFFQTAKDSTNTDFSFIQYGDCGYNNSIQHEIGDLMEADDAEFAVVCGDIDQGGVPHISQDEGGDNYDEIYFDVYNDGVESKMLSQECHYTAIGNHDYYANNGATYDNVFHLPHNNAENSERYYSFTWGDAKFIALDVITPFDPTSFPINFASIDDRWWTDFRAGSPQYQFLENELKCNDKKWVFIYFHEGPWTNYWGADYYIPPNVGGDYYLFEGNVMVRNHLVPLFEQYNVDFVLTGHSHLYERGEKNGVSYITSGSAGDSNPGGNIQYANHPELTVGILENVYAKFYVNNDSVNLEVINNNSNIVDTYSKTKTYTIFDVQSNITNTSCYQGNDGNISVSIDGPKPPYSIEWLDNGDSTLVRTNLSAGTYYAYVKNAYDCEKVVSFIVNEPALLVPQITSITGLDVFCEGDSISVVTSNAANYTSYVWSTGETSAQLDLSLAQTVTVEVISNEGCVGISAPFTVAYQQDPTANFNFANLGFNYNFLAIDDDYVNTYSWDFGDGEDSTLIDGLVSHLFAADGNYMVSLFAENDCAIDTFTMEIIVGKGDSIIDSIPDNIYGISKAERLLVYPNPFNSNATIKTEGMKGKLKFEIYDYSGVIVREFKTTNKIISIDREDLSKGNYFIKITDRAKKTSIAKVIVY